MANAASPPSTITSFPPSQTTITPIVGPPGNPAGRSMFFDHSAALAWYDFAWGSPRTSHTSGGPS